MVTIGASAQTTEEQWTAMAPLSTNTYLGSKVLNIGNNVKAVQVLRSYSDEIKLGIDPATGKGIYPHKSVVIEYAVTCDTKQVAIKSWQLFKETLGQGKVVWADRTF